MRNLFGLPSPGFATKLRNVNGFTTRSKSPLLELPSEALESVLVPEYVDDRTLVCRGPASEATGLTTTGFTAFDVAFGDFVGNRLVGNVGFEGDEVGKFEFKGDGVGNVGFEGDGKTFD